MIAGGYNQILGRQGRGPIAVGGAARRSRTFVAGEVDASYLDSTPLRRVVAESWQRSLAKGVDPDRG